MKTKEEKERCQMSEVKSQRIVLVCGDRNWTDTNRIAIELQKLSNCQLIHGNCRGADRLAAEIGENMGFACKAYNADWKRYGRAAGPIRNRQMLEENNVSLVLAFHSDLAVRKTWLIKLKNGEFLSN